MSDAVIIAALGILGGIFSTIVLDAWKDYRAVKKAKARLKREQELEKEKNEQEERNTQKRVQDAVDLKISELGLTRFNEIVNQNSENQITIRQLIQDKSGLKAGLDTLQITYNRVEADLNREKEKNSILQQKNSDQAIIIGERDQTIVKIRQDRDELNLKQGATESKLSEALARIETLEKENEELEDELSFYRNQHPDTVYVRPQKQLTKTAPLVSPEEETDL